MIERALRLTREFHRMKQGELAKKLNISTSYLSEIESGKKSPSLILLDEYARVFKVPASTFLLFKEQSEGDVDQKSKEHAKRLLKFFEWVTSDEESTGEDETETPPEAGDPKEAIRNQSVRSLRHQREGATER